MKRLLFVCALVALIVLPVTAAVNTHIVNDSPRAEGVVPPPWPGSGIVLAEGMPAPPWPGGGGIAV
jgi:hypothetical protein